MVKIAICDDEEKSVALHERMVRECLQAAGIGCEITTYTQSRNLLYDITDDAFFYDLILLDIEMPGDPAGYRNAGDQRHGTPAADQGIFTQRQDHFCDLAHGICH